MVRASTRRAQSHTGQGPGQDAAHRRKWWSWLAMLAGATITGGAITCLRARLTASSPSADSAPPAADPPVTGNVLDPRTSGPPVAVSAEAEPAVTTAEPSPMSVARDAQHKQPVADHKIPAPRTPSRASAPAPANTDRPREVLRPVSIKPQLFAAGRRVMWAEAALLMGLGGWALVAQVWAPASAPEIVRLLSPTVAHDIGLMVFGLVTAAVTINRRAALVLTGVATVGFLLLFTIGINLVPGGGREMWGFTYASSALHAVLMSTNLALLMWIGGEALEGKPWVPARRSRASGTARTTEPAGPVTDGAAEAGMSVGSGAIR